MQWCLDGGPASGCLKGLAGDVALLGLHIGYTRAEANDVPIGFLEPTWMHKQQTSQWGNDRQILAYNHHAFLSFRSLSYWKLLRQGCVQ